MSGFTQPAIGHSSDAPAYQFLDALAYVRVTGDQTGGRFSVVELQLPEGHTQPQHVHRESDEAIHVLEGALTSHTADGTHRVTAGGTAVHPRGEKHAVVAEEPSVVLASNAPAGFDEYVAAVGEPTDDETVPTPPPAEEAMERARALADDHGIEFVGPPPGQH